MELQRLKIILAYQGTHFAGWQYQPEGQGRSVQACLEEALSRLAGRFVRAIGASRTDSGVHALHQVAHADVPAERARIPWQRALNALLPRDMAVVAVEAAPPGFHARRAAAIKTYAYALWLEPSFLLPQRRPFVWNTGPLDLEAMDQAARAFLGVHDFAAFQNAGTPVARTVREILSLERHPGPTPHEVVWRVRGPGFLKQMVRNMVGCLVHAGRGKANAETVRFLLKAKNRALAPATAPAWGLCLEHMEFGGRERRHPEHGPDGTPDGHLPDQELLGGL